MKVMLLTAATGGGHIRAANAVEEYIRENTGWDVRNVDCLKAVGRLLDKTVCDSYLFMAKKAPMLFGRLYKRTNKLDRLSSLVPKLSGLFSNLLYPTLESYQPDVIAADLHYHRLRRPPGLYRQRGRRLCGSQRGHGPGAYGIRRSQGQDLPLRHSGPRRFFR